jgi:hypothetical protein
VTRVAADFDSCWTPNERGCHIWQRAQAGKYAKFGRGYGCLRINGKLERAHKVAWERTNGPVPAGMHLLHSCDDPRCVNAAHLRLGTNADNMRDRHQRGRYAVKLTEEKVRRILARCAAGESRRAVSEDFGVCSQTVDEIVHRKIWKHVE